MFSAGGIMMIIGILMAMAFIVGGIYFVNRIFVNDTKEILVKFILLVFTALVCLFIVQSCMQDNSGVAQHPPRWTLGNIAGCPERARLDPAAV